MDIRGSTFGKSIAILEMLSGSGDIQESNHIAKALGWSPVTVRRLLREMVEDGFATHDETTNTYSVGQNTLHFASLIRRRFPIERIARPIMREIAVATGETIALNVYLPESKMVICTAIEESQTPLQYVVRVGEHRGLLEGAGGRAISAYLQPEQQSSLYSHGPSERDTKQTRNDLEKDWSQCRKLGYVLSNDNQAPGAVCLGAPVFSDENMAVASIVITIPEHRYKKTAETRLAKTLLKHVAKISFMLGHTVAAGNTAHG